MMDAPPSPDDEFDRELALAIAMVSPQPSRPVRVPSAPPLGRTDSGVSIVRSLSDHGRSWVGRSAHFVRSQTLPRACPPSAARCGPRIERVQVGWVVVLLEARDIATLSSAPGSEAALSCPHRVRHHLTASGAQWSPNLDFGPLPHLFDAAHGRAPLAPPLCSVCGRGGGVVDACIPRHARCACAPANANGRVPRPE